MCYFKNSEKTHGLKKKCLHNISLYHIAYFHKLIKKKYFNLNFIEL